MMMVRLGAALPRRDCRVVRRRRHLLLAILKREISLVQVDVGVAELLLGDEVDVGAYRRDRRRRVELHQGGLQLERVHTLAVALSPSLRVSLTQFLCRFVVLAKVLENSRPLCIAH